ncbi:MAG TPA: hypothetical protein VGS08_00525 [Candidatus Saccharimonadales bacterium]|nr:hypothetical protein [Candidatus Saccharimonadales bacterium]
METRQTINKEVTITAWYFRNRQQLTSFPRRMEFDRHEYTFAEGLRYLVQKGRSVIQLFDMTDGTAKYRLKFDTSEQIWTLVSITDAQTAY